MTTICPNCKREDTMNYDATWGVCNACGHRGNPSAFGWKLEEALKEDFTEPDETKAVLRECLETMKANPPAKRKKGERLHTMYLDENGKTVVGDDW